MFEKELSNKLIYLIKQVFKDDNDDLSVISYDEFLEERTSVMVIVGIESTTQVNPGLDDYQHDVSITIDSLIADDLTGEKFNLVYKKIDEAFRDFLVKIKPLHELFDEVPVVGFLSTGNNFSITGDSNRVTLAFQIFTSAEMF